MTSTTPIPTSATAGTTSRALRATAPGGPRALAGFSLCAMALAAQAQALYTVTDLGGLPGYGACQPTSLNNRGEVAGYCGEATSTPGTMAFVWRNGQMAAVGRLSGGSFSAAMAINASGSTAGDGDTGNLRPQGWVSTPGGLLNFFPNKGGNTRVVFLADSGWIGGYYTKSLSGWTSSWKPAIWKPDPKDPRKYLSIDLPVLPGGIDAKATTAFPLAFNQAGQAVGYGSNDQIGQHATLWLNNASHSIVDLGVYPGDNNSVAYGLNSLGHAVGASHPPFATRPVVWGIDAARTIRALPVLPGDNQGTAYAVNTAGHVLGSSWYGTPGTWDWRPARPVVWRDGGVYALQSLLDPASGAGVVLQGTTAINEAGQITATALRNGQPRALLLTPLN